MPLSIAVHSGPSAEVGIRIERRDDVAVVSVIDDGSGMTTEHAARAFDRFWRRVLPGRSAANPQESKKRRAGSRR